MKVEILYSKEISRVLWNDLVWHSNEGNIYHLFEYINILTEGNWRAVVVREGEEIQAAFVYFVKVKYGLRYFIHPPFCQYWGFILRNGKSTNTKYFDHAKIIITLLLRGIPQNIKYMHALFSPNLTYALPLIWDGWKLRPRYTYQINLKRPLDEILSTFASHTRREIKKAEKNDIKIIQDSNAIESIRIFKQEKPHLVNRKNEIYLNRLEKIVSELPDTQAFSISAISDEKVISSIIYFKYKRILIYFFGTVQVAHKNSGAMSAIIWESIKLHHHNCDILDFDGSMIEGIERFFRGFDAAPIMYLEGKRNLLPKWLPIK